MYLRMFNFYWGMFSVYILHLMQSCCLSVSRFLSATRSFVFPVEYESCVPFFHLEWAFIRIMTFLGIQNSSLLT